MTQQEWIGAGRVTPGTRFATTTTVRDALYDLIPLSAPELSLIGTPAFLRLERIQQLGFVSRVWPGARHTRFEHSLGVFHLARLALEHLRSIPDGAWIDDEDARTIAAAALLHDIGHYPFSHAIEELGDPIAPHEQVGRHIVEGERIGAILLQEWGVDPRRVGAIVDPKRGGLEERDLTLRAILSGPLDVDKLDYLPRDARACHVPYGGVDTARLIDSLGFARIDESTRIVVGEKGVSPLHSLINARQEMFDNVYWHHTNRACMAMLLRAVQDALLAGAVKASALTEHDDASLLALLGSAAMPESTQRLTAALGGRHIHKRALEISSRSPELHASLGSLFYEPAARRQAEIQMAERLAAIMGHHVPDVAVLIDLPKPERWRTDVWVRFDHPPLGFEGLMTWRDVVGLQDDDFKRYEEHRRLIRIVVEAPLRATVREHWPEIVLPALAGAR